ncbi:uncharacterized protein LOC126733787 isoform X2 [Anthonomus grandis grandis]|uniref:uncharacterized protein LOC126733787 isoform X2 n=1 Tax=Anthonomus grandis grandis TaxID=2921223 RepID=UPI0021651A13|nr:uncharacterized protein LOC126733787 isoform X2 [Anthonomus grandis grandis]
MTSFMSKKKKYKFQVEICLEELLEVPFVSAVLFAKMRLLDGGNFQDNSSRQEVRDHMVHWDAKFSFPCKMMANASTGVMEKCILRISIRKECKGGRSFTKLGFVDLNLAEYAGAGLIHKKALLEGYDMRHRQDNSMLKFRIQLNMIAGDILFKAPSPSLKHKSIPKEDTATDQRSDEFSSGSLAGSINSGSSGFGSLPKKRTPLPAELVIGQTLSESNHLAPIAVPFEAQLNDHCLDQTSEHINSVSVQEPGHSRNSSNTSQMSKASGYSSISHSRHSSSGDSTAGHIRNALQHESLRRPVSKFQRTYTFPKHRLNIPTTIPSESPGPQNGELNDSEVFHTPQSSISTLSHTNGETETFYTPQSEFITPKKYVNNKTSELAPSLKYQKQKSVQSSASEDYKTPDDYFGSNVFDKNFNALQKSASSSVVETIRNNQSNENNFLRGKNDNFNEVDGFVKPSLIFRHSENCNNNNYNLKPPQEGVLRSKSDFIIPKKSPEPRRNDRTWSKIAAFLTPRMHRKDILAQSTPVRGPDSGLIPPFSDPLSTKDTRAVSMGNLKLGNDGQLAVYCAIGSRNPSSGSLQTNSDTGSLDRAKAAYERRKKNPIAQDDTGVSGRVETTRVNPEECIADLLKNTNLGQADDSAETSGLQLFIAKDGTASLGSHEVKSQMSTGIPMFKQVVMDDR